MLEDGQRDALPSLDKEKELLQRSKKGKLQMNTLEAAELKVPKTDVCRLVPEDEAGPITLSKADKASQLILSDDRLTVSGTRGFRSVRATVGVSTGTWYCEFKVGPLGDTGHCRLGWCTKRADLQVPVGADANGFSYRDLDGSKVHKALREPYGSSYKSGDVVGLFIHLPNGGEEFDLDRKNIVRYKGYLYSMTEQQDPRLPLQGSFVAFRKNGEWQGVAYRDISNGRYFPAVSVFTLPEQLDGAAVSANFGPDFAYPDLQYPDGPLAQPYANASKTLC